MTEIPERLIRRATEARKKASASRTEPPSQKTMVDTEEWPLHTYRVGFFVEVEVKAIDRGDALHIANGAARFPFNRDFAKAYPEQYVVEGEVNGNPVEGRYTSAVALMIERIDDGRD